MALYSLEIETHFLSGLINNSNIYFELDGMVGDQDFHNETHNIIFSVLKDLILSGEKFDKVLLAQKIKNLGIKFQDNLNIFEYINTLAFLKIRPEAAIESAKELVRLRGMRQIYQAATNVQSLINKGQNKSLQDILSESEALFAQEMSIFQYEDEIENLFDGMEELIEERGNNPMDEDGLKTPFLEYNKFHGGIRKGSLFAIASRPKQGKSSFLVYLAFKCSQLTGFKIPALFLDTEMFSLDMKFRLASMLTGVPSWYLSTGNWRKNQEMFKVVRLAWNEIKKFQFYHIRVGSKDIDQVSSIIRRWILSKVKGKINDTGEAIIVYDYFKLTGEKLGQNWAEHQVLGQKIDKFINLSAKYQFYPLSSIQMNRTGENFNRKAGGFVDDSSAIAGTDKLQQLGSHVGIFRRKTLDEIALDGPQFGTHMYLNTASRFQGRDSQGHSDFLKRTFPDGSEKNVPNYINFEVKNFNVTEKGSLRNVIDSYKEQINLTGDKPKSDGDLM